MKKMFKKSVSILLSIIMIVSLFTIIPLTASAAVTYTIKFTYGTTDYTVSNVTSLTNLSYNLYSTVGQWFNYTGSTNNPFRASNNPNFQSTDSSVAQGSGTSYNAVVNIKKTGTATVSWRRSGTGNTTSLTIAVSANDYGYDSAKDPSGKSNLTYTGSAQTLVNTQNYTYTEGQNTFSYRFSTNTSATTQPQDNSYTQSTVSATNAGTYHIWWIWDTDASYNGAPKHGDFTVTIGKATLSNPTVTPYSAAYDASAHGITVTSTAGTVYYSKDGALTAVNYATAGSTTNPTFTDADTYTVYWFVYAGNNYNPAYKSGSSTVTITKDDVTLVDPTANDLTYTTEAQDLVTEGSVSTDYNEDGGELQYSSDGETYSTTVPQGTAAGNYTVYYRVVGDKNHNDIDAQSIDVEIKKATPTADVKVKNLYYTGEALELVQSATVDFEECTLWFSLDNGLNELQKSPKGIDIGTYKVYSRIEGTDNCNDVPYSDYQEVKIVAVPTISMDSYTYGTELPTPVVTGNEGEGEVTYLYAAKSDNPEWKEFKDMDELSLDVGDYLIKAEIAATDDYVAVSTEPAEFTVSAKTVDEPTITIDPDKNVYSGSDIEPAVTVKDGDVVIADTEYAVEYSENVNAGTATVTITDVEGGNYVVSGTLEFVIDKKDITPEVTMSGYTYGDETVPVPTLSGNEGEGEYTFYYNTANSTEGGIEWTDIAGDTLDAGTYYMYAVVGETDNYNGATSEPVEFVIAKADITPTLSIEGWTYDDEPNAPVVEGNTGEGTVTYLYKVKDADDSTYTEEVPVNANNYVVKATIAETTNYNGFEIEPVEFTIEKKDPEMGEDKDYNVVGKTIPYNTEQQALVDQYIKDGSGLQIEYSFYPGGLNPQILGNIPHADEIGTYAIFFRVIGNDNYNDVAWIVDPVTAEIIKATPDVSVDALDATYGDTLADVTLPVETNGTWAWDDEDTTSVGDAGEQTFSATYTPNDTDHYESVTQDVTVNVAKADITPEITITGWACGHYDETVNGPTVSGNNGEGEVTYQYKVKDADDETYTDERPDTVGDFTVKATVAETDNYNGAEATADFTLVMGEIDPEIILENWVYGDEPNSPVINEGGNPGNGDVAYTYAFKNSDAYSEIKPVLPGNYTVKAVIAETDNYYGKTVYKDFVIKDGAFTPTVTITGWAYGEDANAPEISGNVSGGEVKFTYAPKGSDAFSATVPTAAGDYVVKATVAATDNYEAVEATAEFTIAKADITPTVTLAGWTYGEDANAPETTGNAGEGEVAYTYAVKGSDEFTADVPVNAGEFTVKATVAETANYNGGEATADFTIAKADITPTVTLEGWTYGEDANAPETTGNPGEGEVAYTYAPIGSEDFTADVPTEAGMYTVKATVAETANYNSGEDTEIFVIDTAASSISVSIQGWTYGQAANEPVIDEYDGDGTAEVTFTYASADALDAAAGDDDAVAACWSDEVPVNAGKYFLRASVAATNNYNPCTEYVPFAIAKADITPTVTLEGWTYGEDANAPETTGNAGEGEVAYTYAAKGSDEFTADVPVNAGEFTVKATVAETANYNGGEATADFTIAKADLTVTAQNQNVNYGGVIDQSKYTVKGLVEGDKITVKLNQSITKNTITPTVTGADNYNVKVNSGLLGILGMPNSKAVANGKQVTVTWGASQIADGYLVCAAYRGESSYELVADTTDTSFNITKLHGKAIDPSKILMVITYAYRNINGKQVKLIKSPTIYVCGTSTKNTNVVKVTVANSEVTLAVGKTSQISATVKLADGTKKALNVPAAIRYATSHSSVATVSADGTITAVGKGTANIYAYAQNGIKAKVVVTVN